MKCSVVVLALGALTCTLVSPLGAAMWGGAQPLCGCSASACYCPHGSDAPRGAAIHEGHVHGGHAHGGSSHNGHRSRGSHSRHGHGHPAPVPVEAVQPHPVPSADASRCPELSGSSHQQKNAGQQKNTGEGCELRHCGRGSMPGTGVLPVLPDGKLPASTALSTPDLWGSPDREELDLPPDVFPGVEPPPPRR
jgi:hypothetical protein